MSISNVLTINKIDLVNRIGINIGDVQKDIDIEFKRVDDKYNYLIELDDIAETIGEHFNRVRGGVDAIIESYNKIEEQLTHIKYTLEKNLNQIDEAVNSNKSYDQNIDIHKIDEDSKNLDKMTIDEVLSFALTINFIVAKHKYVDLDQDPVWKELNKINTVCSLHIQTLIDHSFNKLRNQYNNNLKQYYTMHFSALSQSSNNILQGNAKLPIEIIFSKNTLFDIKLIFKALNAMETDQVISELIDSFKNSYINIRCTLLNYNKRFGMHLYNLACSYIEDNNYSFVNLKYALDEYSRLVFLEQYLASYVFEHNFDDLIVAIYNNLSSNIYEAFSLIISKFDNINTIINTLELMEIEKVNINNDYIQLYAKLHEYFISQIVVILNKNLTQIYLMPVDQLFTKGSMDTNKLDSNAELNTVYYLKVIQPLFSSYKFFSSSKFEKIASNILSLYIEHIIKIDLGNKVKEHNIKNILKNEITNIASNFINLLKELSSKQNLIGENKAVDKELKEEPTYNKLLELLTKYE